MTESGYVVCSVAYTGPYVFHKHSRHSRKQNGQICNRMQDLLLDKEITDYFKFLRRISVFV